MVSSALNVRPRGNAPLKQQSSNRICRLAEQFCIISRTNLEETAVASKYRGLVSAMAKYKLLLSFFKPWLEKYKISKSSHLRYRNIDVLTSTTNACSM